MAATVSRDRMSELPPWITINGTGERVELPPQILERSLQIDAVENRSKLRVVGDDNAVVCFFPGPLGLLQPLASAEIGKLGRAEPAQNVGALFECAGRWQIAKDSLDANQPPRLRARHH